MMHWACALLYIPTVVVYASCMFYKSILFAGLLPFSKADLKAKLDNFDKQLTNPLIPTLGLRIYKSSPNKVRVSPHLLPLLTTEGGTKASA